LGGAGGRPPVIPLSNVKKAFFWAVEVVFQLVGGHWKPCL